MSIIYEPKGRAREYAELAANLYSGCAHGCEYCYAPGALRINKTDFRLCVKPRKDCLQQLEKDAAKLAGTDKRILLSFSTDPYQPCEEQYGLTRQAIEILHSHNIGVTILTKGGMRAARDFDLLGQADTFGTSLTFTDIAQSMEWEPGAAIPGDRLAAMKLAHEKGIPTWASIEPVIDPAQSLDLIQVAIPFCDYYKVGKLNHHPLAKTIDWCRFGGMVRNTLEEAGKHFYIKEDLRKEMGVSS